MKITAVMPTSFSRRSYWDGAIKCFLDQTYLDCNLLIVDEAPKPADRSFPDRVSYECITAGRKLNTGEKRNFTNQRASGEVIVHFDDDDWSHPLRIEKQLSLLVESKKQVVGYHDLFFYKVGDQSLWKYKYQGRGAYGSGTTLMYYKSWWEAHPFLSTSIGEDAQFSAVAASSNQMISSSCGGLLVARSHNQNTFKSNQFTKSEFSSVRRDQFPAEFLREVNL